MWNKKLLELGTVILIPISLKMDFTEVKVNRLCTPKSMRKPKMLIVCLYVDDLIFTGDYGIVDFKVDMESEFQMTDLGLMNYFLGIEVHSLKVVFLYHKQSMQVKF